jgi:hypothetical protein
MLFKQRKELSPPSFTPNGNRCFERSASNATDERGAKGSIARRVCDDDKTQFYLKTKARTERTDAAVLPASVFAPRQFRTRRTKMSARGAFYLPMAGNV